MRSHSTRTRDPATPLPHVQVGSMKGGGNGQERTVSMCACVMVGGSGVSLGTAKPETGQGLGGGARVKRLRFSRIGGGPGSECRDG